MAVGEGSVCLTDHTAREDVRDEIPGCGTGGRVGDGDSRRGGPRRRQRRLLLAAGIPLPVVVTSGSQGT